MVYKDKFCELCKKKFTPLSGRSIFCSNNCAYIFKRKKILKWRENNLEEYKNACIKYNKNRDIKKLNNNKIVLKYQKYTCINCNDEFIPKSSIAKYCSKKCKNKYSNILKKKDRKINPEKYRIRDKKYYDNNESAKIGSYLRKRLYKAITSQGGKKTLSIKNLLGCTIYELKDYLESKFDKNMKWDNYGKWHIDHIKPCASFNLLNINEQKECFSYLNLQPLWAYENQSKGCKYNEN